MNRILILALTTSMLSPLAMAEPEPAASGPRPGTVEAMQCLTRQGPAKCERVFQGQAQFAAKDWVFPDQDRDFKRGALLSSTFRRPATNSNGCDAMTLGRLPTKEMDIFDIKFTHAGYRVYVSVPDADGKIPALAILPPFDPSRCR